MANVIHPEDLFGHNNDQGLVGHTLEVDSSETDSALGDDTASLTTSVNSTVTDYRFENGRRYHGYQDGAYHLPNDEVEAERLDLQHEVWRLTLNGALHLAPIPDSAQFVLDVGTGTGLWAIEFAEAHPSMHITGTDLSPIQPPWVPPNCRFEIDNAEETWTFDKEFDYIHARLLCFGMRNWPRFFEQCWNNLKPGGWLEMQEVNFPPRCADSSAGPDSPMLQWGQCIREASLKVGVNTEACVGFKQLLLDQGFVNVKEEPLMWPVGTWPKGKKEKKIGQYMMINTMEALQGVSMALLTRHKGWSKEEVEVYLIDVRKDILNPKKHFYAPMYVHYAQKPAEAEMPAKEDEMPVAGDEMLAGKEETPAAHDKRPAEEDIRPAGEAKRSMEESTRPTEEVERFAEESTRPAEEAERPAEKYEVA